MARKETGQAERGPVPAQFILPMPAAAALPAGLRDALLERTEPACLVAFGDDGRMDRLLVEAAHRLGIPVLLALSEEAPRQVGADGVYLLDTSVSPAELAGWRDMLGEDGMLAVFCGTSRHAAMDAAEAGADVIAFGGDPSEVLDLVEWWAGLMEVPCIAAGAATAEQAAALARAGADFVMADPGAWDAGGPALLEAMAEAVAEAVAEAAAGGSISGEG